MFQDFTTEIIDAGEAAIFTRRAGSGPPVLLLHGFPQTHLMWRHIAARLTAAFTVVCADLRGYGDSNCPLSGADHAAYSKRTMAMDMVRVMDRLGFESFAVVGHDRGGRVASRLALDHSARVTKAAVLDVLPLKDAFDRADAKFALGYWPWSLLAQDAPLPETILQRAADAIVDSALSGWGSSDRAFPPEVRAAYSEALRRPDHAHAICEEYRAAAGIDREHDSDDLDAGRKMACPLLLLWGRSGPLDTWYAQDGGPLAIWRRYADDVRGQAIDGGHFFPEANPDESTSILHAFLKEAN